MNCIYHKNREADCFCDNCKQPVCRTCFSSLGGLCVRCEKQLNREIIKKDIITIVLVIVFAIFGTYFSFDSDFDLSQILMSAILFGAAPLGWKGLNKIKPNVFLILPIAGWAVYFFVKALISLLVGWILFIPQIILIVKDFTMVKKTKSIIENL